MLRIILRGIFKLLYRVDVQGMEHYRQAGKRTLIVANHTSFLDAALLVAFLPGEFSFAVHTRIVKRWFMRPFLRVSKLFVMDPTRPFSIKSLIQYLKADHRVVIFPEGRITVTGALMKIYHGPGLVADRADAEVLPIRIHGAQYSQFSRLRKQIRVRLFPKITLTILPPRKITAPAGIQGRARRKYAGEVLTALMNEMMFATSQYRRTLFEAIIDAQRIHGRKHLIAEDIDRVPLNYQQLISRSFMLATALRRHTEVGAPTGVLLPNATGAILTLFALQIARRVPALLDINRDAEALLCDCRTAQIHIVLTSRRFVRYARLDATLARLEQQVRVVYLEDRVGELGWLDKLRGLLDGWFPCTAYRRHGPQPAADDPAVVLFTAGSTGTPKAVVLSHANLLANCAQITTRVDFSSRDIIFTALPMYHALGLTAGSILPLITGMRVFFYPLPQHYRIIPEIAYDVNATIMFSTDSLLTEYARVAHPYDFYSMRYVFSGLEKLQDSTRQLWSERFGLRIFEGYGATETGPMLSMNTPMDNQPGTAGCFLPGIEYKLTPLPDMPGQRLWVRGPNVMLGYYTAQQPGVLQTPGVENWHDTGDRVSISSTGHVSLLGRVQPVRETTA